MLDLKAVNRSVSGTVENCLSQFATNRNETFGRIADFSWKAMCFSVWRKVIFHIFKNIKYSHHSYVALYSYRGRKADELELRKGYIYTVTEKCQDGWYKGRCITTDRAGVFPGNYVQVAKYDICLLSVLICMNFVGNL